MFGVVRPLYLSILPVRGGRSHCSFDGAMTPYLYCYFMFDSFCDSHPDVLDVVLQEAGFGIRRNGYRAESHFPNIETQGLEIQVQRKVLATLMAVFTSSQSN